MRFEPIADYIESNLGFVQGKTLFINQAPYDVDGVMLLRDSGVTNINGEIKGMRKGAFQIVMRGSAYQPMMEAALAVSDLLTMWETTMDTIQIKSLRPLSEPLSYMLSAGNNFEISVNFSIIYAIV
jgi:hypothetical protein